MILAICILPPPHAKVYVCSVTWLPHILQWKPNSDRHLTIFPVECHVFHQMHRAPFSRFCLPIRRVSSPPSLVVFLIWLPLFELWRFRRSLVENPLAAGSLSIFPASSVGPWILCKRVSKAHQFVSSLLHVLLNAVFHRPVRVYRKTTLGATLIESTDDRLLSFSYVYYFPLIACWCRMAAQTRSLLQG